MATKPNILLIMADQLRADALGCYGNEVCRTPHLDALGAAGVVFENGLTPNPICVPARATLITGNYSHVCNGSKANSGRIGDDQIKMPAHFAACGYETYACGKLHYVPYAKPGEPRLLHGFQHCDLTESGRYVWAHDRELKHRGVEEYIDYLEDVGWGGYSRAHGVGNNDVRSAPTPLPAEHHVDHWVADRAIQRMQAHVADHPDKPFLIFCSFPKPHAPLDPPYDYVKMYDPRQIPPPVGSESMLADRNPTLEARRHTHAFTTLSPAAQQVIKAYYYATISWQDAQIARVLEALTASGQADNTIVIYTADHGDLMGDFGTYFKSCFLRGSVSVPFLFKAPGVAAGQRRSQLVGLQDILPTLATLTDCPLDRDVQGVDLTEALHDDGAEIRDVYYGSCGNAPSQSAMLFDGRWKYCYAQIGPTEELYDLAEDPDELVNLATQPHAEELLADWRRRLIEEAHRLGDAELLDGEKLAEAPLDRSAFAELPVRGLGWRWF